MLGGEILDCLEARYWHEVDSYRGRNAHEFYVPDGLMVVGHNRFQGRDKIKEFYEWRQRMATTGISCTTTRHLINHLFVEPRDDGRAKVLGIVSFYSAAVRAPAPQCKPPHAGRGPRQRMRVGPRQPLAIQITHPPARVLGLEAPLSIAIDTHRAA